jgi:hypothetical protein
MVFYKVRRDDDGEKKTWCQQGKAVSFIRFVQTPKLRSDRALSQVPPPYPRHRRRSGLMVPGTKILMEPLSNASILTIHR